jgi:23S rRNA pseudoU1915 N3-methylase RlmH
MRIKLGKEHKAECSRKNRIYNAQKKGRHYVLEKLKKNQVWLYLDFKGATASPLQFWNQLKHCFQKQRIKKITVIVGKASLENTKNSQDHICIF